ncbi:putative XRE-type DNA-binding protein [Clostridium beijerinckii]|uniref:hypothetical protein n=1 Tax=Clostridium beijerinckii TaxID=1520 RepID=UPI001494A726|nr:hypothetical protein [Clostridium beijerinckii]NOW87952.1 putative XRE-type DNA-binding protein [Clostridium beijerinckii]
MLLEEKKSKKEKHNITKQILEKKIIPFCTAEYKEDAITELNIIHANKDGFITIATKPKEGTYSQWHVEFEEFIPKVQNFMKTDNVYISMNSFYTTQRRLTTIRHLNCFWVDLDYYKVNEFKDKTTEEMINLLREKNLFEKTGEPSFFIDSGHGMYIVWLIKDCSKQMVAFWQVIQNKIFEIFETFGADNNALDVTRVLKLAGTVHGETKRRARFIYNSQKEFRFEQEKEEIRIYTIQELGDKLLDKLPFDKVEWNKLKAKKRKTKAEKAKCRTISMFNLHTLNYARMNDILKLIELRQGKCNDYRELMCFLYRYYSCCFLKDTEQALRQALEINNLFTEPLGCEEVIKATESATAAYELWLKTFNEYMELNEKPNIVQYFRKKGCYIYSNKKLIELLKILEEEMVSLETIINTKEKNRRNKDYRNEWNKSNFKKKRRNENGFTMREQAKEDKIKQIEELFNKGLKQNEIAEIVGLNKSGVSRYIKQIKQNNIEKVVLENIETNNLELNEMFKRVDTTDVEVVIC